MRIALGATVLVFFRYLEMLQWLEPHVGAYAQSLANFLSGTVPFSLCLLSAAILVRRGGIGRFSRRFGITVALLIGFAGVILYATTWASTERLAQPVPE